MSPSLRCCLVAIGSQGDVAPFVALGQELASRGHRVRLVVLAPWADLGRQDGLEVVAVPRGTEALWPRSPAWRRAALAQPAVMWAAMTGRVHRAGPAILDAVLEAGDDADVLVSGALTAGACATLAAAEGIGSLHLALAPLQPAGDPSGSVLVPGRLPPVVAWPVSSLLWLMTRAMGLSPTLRMALRLRRWPHRATDRLLATSLVLAPAGGRLRQVGRLAPPGSPSPLPPELASWLDRHPDAVMMGFGSCPVASPQRDLAMFRRAAARLRRPLLLQTPLLPTGAHGSTFNAPGVDHRALLGRVAAVVHHGGAGTTATALASGASQVVVPHLGDQPYYARRVTDLGVGVDAGPRWRLGSRRLARAVTRALAPDVLLRCRELAQQVGYEPGTAAAADAVVALAGRFSATRAG